MQKNATRYGQVSKHLLMPKIVDIEERCNQIAQAACHAIMGKGIDKTTMVDIANQAGVTTGMITHYYKSKNEILAAALRLIFHRTEQRLDTRHLPGEDPLFSILKETLPLDAERHAESAVWVSFWGAVSNDEELARVNLALHQDAEELYARVIRTAWPESANWQPAIFLQTCHMVLSFLNGLTASAVTSPQSWPGDRLLQSLQLQLSLVHSWAESTSQQSATTR
ncbi:MAG: TetR/AcrR family bet gene transcriptional repressor [Parasphingorhabdus sp.]